MSPSPIRILTTQTVLIDNQNIIHRSPAAFPKFWGKKTKAITKVTLRDQPIKFVKANGSVLTFDP